MVEVLRNQYGVRIAQVRILFFEILKKIYLSFKALLKTIYSNSKLSLGDRDGGSNPSHPAMYILAEQCIS